MAATDSLGSLEFTRREARGVTGARKEGAREEGKAEGGGVRPGKEFVQFKLRIRRELKDRIEAEARENNRSANAEAVAMLEDEMIHRTRPLYEVVDDVRSGIVVTTPVKIRLGDLVEDRNCD
jgi:hypothetical protein